MSSGSLMLSGNSNSNGDTSSSQNDAVPIGKKNPLWFRMSWRLSELRCSVAGAATHVSTAAGLSGSTAGRLEDEGSIARLDTAERLAAGLGVSPTWLVYGPEGTSRWMARRPRDPLPADPPVASLAPREPEGLAQHVGQRLRDAREAARLSLRAVARAAGLSPQGVLLIEQSRTVPLVSTVEELAKAVSVAPGWLAFGEGDGPGEDSQN